MARGLPWADRVVAVSRSLVESAVALGVDRARIDLVMNGVDTSLFHPRDRAEARAALGHAGDSRRWIVCVSRLREDKGTLDSVAAFTALAGERDDLVLALVGDGEARGAVETALRPFGDRVILSGARPLAEVPLWMGAADVVTLPSHHEGTPNVLLEALACGRRVVATAVGGIPDVVNDAALGTLVPAGDPAALAAALREAALTDVRSRRRGGTRGARRLGRQRGQARSVAGAGRGRAPGRRATEAAPAGTHGAAATTPVGSFGGAAAARRRFAAAAVGAPRAAAAAADGADVRRRPGRDDRRLPRVLARYDARATFFMIGDACRRWPEQLARVAAHGHELGGHGFTHTPFPKLSAEALQDELARTEALLPPRPHAGGPRLVRPPLGATSPLSLLRCARAGYVTALWSRDSDDCRTRVAEEVAANVSPDSMDPGDVICFTKLSPGRWKRCRRCSRSCARPATTWSRSARSSASPTARRAESARGDHADPRAGDRLRLSAHRRRGRRPSAEAGQVPPGARSPSGRADRVESFRALAGRVVARRFARGDGDRPGAHAGARVCRQAGRMDGASRRFGNQHGPPRPPAGRAGGDAGAPGADPRPADPLAAGGADGAGPPAGAGGGRRRVDQRAAVLPVPAGPAGAPAARASASCSTTGTSGAPSRPATRCRPAGPRGSARRSSGRCCVLPTSSRPRPRRFARTCSIAFRS